MMIIDETTVSGRAEYDALPGTAPDCYSAIERDSFLMSPKVQESVSSWRKSGMTHFRVTVEPKYIWVEGWKERPYKEAPFNPPYTAQSEPEVHLE